MRHFYRIHGRHCYLRSFQTICKKCGADVLYWECRHGSKVFFNYPPYGKLIRHYCRHHIGVSKQKKTFRVNVKTPKGLLENSSPSCPVCGKLFREAQSLKYHLENSKNNDLHHKLFLENKFEEEYNHKLKKKSDHDKRDSILKFGKINLKEV